MITWKNNAENIVDKKKSQSVQIPTLKETELGKE